MHHILTPLGGVLTIAGLSIAIYMVAASGGPHPRVPHGWVGAVIIALILLTIDLGVLRDRWIEKNAMIRPFHVLPGQTVPALMIVSILLGLWLAVVI